MNNAFGVLFATILLLPVLIILSGVMALVVAWPVMLLIGSASIASDGLVPAIGYGTTFWLTWAATLVTSRANAA